MACRLLLQLRNGHAAAPEGSLGICQNLVCVPDFVPRLSKLHFSAAVFAQGEAPMPLDFCHPEAPHKKLRMPEWYVSSLMMDRALDAIVRRVKHLDREHDIPYLAGYSLDGNTIYIDRHMPNS